MSIVIAAPRPLGPQPSTSAAPTVLPIVSVRRRPLSISWPLLVCGFLAGSLGNAVVFVFLARHDPWTVLATYNVLGLCGCTVTRRPGWGVGFLLGALAAFFLGVWLLVQALSRWTF